ncbi:MAG: hypothetical protein KUG72_11390 [Pseudomonadales bacterium]|nr:hypothetical protein [Pseudomonadales bacterium]
MRRTDDERTLRPAPARTTQTATGLTTVKLANRVGGKCEISLKPNYAAIIPLTSFDPNLNQKEKIMGMKEAYEKKLQAQLDEWSAEIDKLKAKADKAEADTQLEYYKKIEDLRSMQESSKEKLAELKEASDDAWEDLKAGLDSAWDSLGSALKSATSRFK